MSLYPAVYSVVFSFVSTNENESNLLHSFGFPRGNIGVGGADDDWDLGGS